MIDYLQNKFIEEAGDLISDLEKCLLELEEQPNSPALIDRIFRALHTLKGSGAMFGYELISDFTHDLETLYDEVRMQKVQLTKDLMDLTLQSVDLIRDILNKPNSDSKIFKERTVAILNTIRKLTGKELIIAKSDVNPKKTIESNIEKAADFRNVYICFKPGKDILKNGNNPLFLIDELYNLGSCKVRCNAAEIPDYELIDVYSCYISWEIELLSNVTFDEIREVFLFVEDLAEILISENPFPSWKLLNESNVSPVTIEKYPLFSDDDKNTTFLIQQNAVNQVNTIRVSSEKLDQLMNLVSELVTMQARLDLLAATSGNSEALILSEGMHKLSSQLRDTTLEICMVPLQGIVTRFQRLVRDLGKELNKEINFVTEGMETELDKNIIENITDPILHLIRNCIDHGIENSEIRKLVGKPHFGTITFKAYHSGPNVILEIQDDGAGINDEMVYQKAVQSGIILSDSILTQNEIRELLFQPGFTTTTEVTAISGRGVGLDVVKQQVNLLRGTIIIKSERGKGTNFIITLPLILSIIDGLLVDISGEHFIIPLELVSKIMIYKQEMLSDAYHNLISFEAKKIPFFNLRKEFNINSSLPEYSEIIIVNYLGQEVGLAVDKVVGQQQAVIKPLGKVFNSVNLFSGATILGNGNVALVIDIHRMIHELSNEKAFIQ